jgi:glycosyltransferase involved in cell wall biosynthesis
MRRGSLLKGIVINGRFLSQPMTGVQRYAFELLRELDQILTDAPHEFGQVEVLVPRNIRSCPDYSSLSIKNVGRFTGQTWEQLELPLHCKGKLLFTPCGGAPVLHDCNVVTVPDAAVLATPKAYSLAYRTWYRMLLSAFGARAKRIVTVSDFSKYELNRLCGIPLSNIVVTPLGSNHVLAVQPDQTVLEKHGLKNIPYVLAVSSHNPNKNFQGVIKATSLLRNSQIRLAIAGDVNPEVFGKTTTIPATVIQLGRVTDAELRALYEGAGCFVFPSFYEGFGLPPLEAMACNCPVVASNIEALRETCGSAALYCEPGDPQSIADSIDLVFESDEARSDWKARGCIRAHEFSWARTAAETWSLLQEVAAAT